MSTQTTNLPGNANTITPISENIGGTGISNPLGNTITVTGGPIVFNAASGGSTIQLQHISQLSWGGGSTSHAFTVTGLTASSVCFPVLEAKTNTAEIISFAPTTDTLTITFDADPGAATTINLLWVAAAQP